MATQLKPTDFQPSSFPAARPNLRVVFDTTSATSAVATALDDLPPAVRDATLEDLELASSAEALIATARHLLSRHVYGEFLFWGMTAVRFSGKYSDEEGESLLKRLRLALDDVGRAVPLNVHDLAFKAYLLALEASDGPSFGPCHVEDGAVDLVNLIARGVAPDLEGVSPVVAGINNLGRQAVAASPTSANWSPAVTEVIVQAFEVARQVADDLPPTRSFAPNSAELAPATQGALLDWNATCKAYNVAVEISAATDGENDLDNLAGAAESYALHRLMLTPAPSLSTLAMKSRLYEATECWELNAAKDIARVFTNDVERFAKVSHPIEASEFAGDDAWSSAERELASLGERLRVPGLSDEQIDTLTDQETQAYNRLLALPARSNAQVMSKLQAMTVMHTHVPAGEVATAVAELKRFLPAARTVTPCNTDGALLDAFATYRATLQRLRTTPILTDKIEEPLFAIMDSAAATVIDQRAVSIEGVLAKLRLGFSGTTEDAWGPDAVLDPSSKRFAEGLPTGGLSPRIFWSAIEDLARIGGVELSATPAHVRSADQHRGWFKARNGLNGWLNGDMGPDTDDTMSDGCGMLNQYDNRILQTPVTTVDGLLTQLVLAAQLHAEGHDIGDVECGKLVASAQRLAGLGSIDGFIRPVEQAA